MSNNVVKFSEYPQMLFKGNNKGVKHIIIHNSALGVTAFNTAKSNYNNTPQGVRSAFAHWYVDDQNCIQLARENWIAWHAGDRTMNENSIGIVICVNPMDCYTKCKRGNCDKITTLCAKQEEQIKKFYKAEQNTIDLIHVIMAKWGLDESCLLFHSDVKKKTACPYFTKKLHNLTRARDFLTIFGS